MCGDSKAIVETFKQILDIYKQIYMLMETAKELMAAGTMQPGSIIGDVGNYKNYHEDSHFGTKIVRIPFNIQQSFTSDSEPTQIKYITVMIDDDRYSDLSKDFEPVVVGTTLKFVDEANNEKNKKDWDGYWWYQWKWKEAKESDPERRGPWTLEKFEVNEIQKQDWIKEQSAVRSNLQSVYTLGIPLVDVTNTETLEKEIIKRLLAV